MYELVATGGTFDRFHKGHEALLGRAFTVGKKVIIGVTTEQMVVQENKVLGRIVMPYKERVQDVTNYLNKIGVSGREIITPLNDIYGPVVIDNRIEAIVCTRETRTGAAEINRHRLKTGRKKLAVVECQFVTSSDRRHISSTRIRLGQHDREGIIFNKINFGSRLPKSVRNSLKKPVGKVYDSVRKAINEVKKPVIVVTVGDVVNKQIKKEKMSVDITVADLKINRQAISIENDFLPDFTVRNSAGTVSHALVETTAKAVRKNFTSKKKIVIRVIGEEDLAVLPLIIHLPLQSLILYGQPAIDNIKEGVVAVIVTEDKKKWAIGMLRQFK